MLKSIGHANYYSFRLPYWDWRVEIQKSTGIPAEELFTENRFGATHNVNGYPQVVGDIVGPDGWDSLCYQTHLQICDPNVNTGALRRCPFTGNNPCTSDNPDWPTIQQVNDAIAIDAYDSPPYNLLSTTGYVELSLISTSTMIWKNVEMIECACVSHLVALTVI